MVVNALKSAGLDWTDQYINLMAMDYGMQVSMGFCFLSANVPVFLFPLAAQRSELSHGHLAALLPGYAP